MALRQTPEINAGSTADIAFLLLIFFLVSTTMDQEKGLQRRLPPMPDENKQQIDQKVNRRNIVVVKINSNNNIFAGSEPMDISMLKDKIKDFVMNPNNDVNLPEREMKDIEGFGQCSVSKGVVSLQNDRGTSYDAYLRVQNEIVKAFNEIRDEFAINNYGKKYLELEEDQQKVVRTAVPQNISEAEPKDVTKKK